MHRRLLLLCVLVVSLALTSSRDRRARRFFLGIGFGSENVGRRGCQIPVVLGYRTGRFKSDGYRVARPAARTDLVEGLRVFRSDIRNLLRRGLWMSARRRLAISECHPRNTTSSSLAHPR